MIQFTHLHLHSQFSILDGTIKIDNLIEKLQELKMDSCAITDHGVMYGAYKFHKGMIDAGMKPIIGCEIYIAPRKLEQKEAGIDNKYNHMVLLAKNLEGYKNLMKIVSIGHMEGFYYKPRVDVEVLKKYSKGIVAATACLGGVVAKELMKDNYEQAEKNALMYKDIFTDGFYMEIQRNGLDEQDEVNPKMIEIARKHNIPIVATTDAHYLEEEDAMIQEVLWCIADGRTLDDPTRRKMGTQEFYVKSTEQMNDLFADIPEAIENTQVIKDSIEVFSLKWERVEPEYLDLPKDETPPEHLRKLVEKGANEKYGEITPELQERIDYELSIINDKGYSNYFLVVYDFVNYCVENNIMVGARGSAVGTVVGYTLNIASVDPIKWNLIFERFLNPGRDSPPDIDLDISDKRRFDVIEYGRRKYGDEKVRLIIAFSKLQTRAAIRDVSRLLGIDLSIADQLSKMVEVVFGKAKDIDYMIEHNKEFAQIIESSPELQNMANIVRKVAGLVRGVTTHACGVVVAPTAVDDYVPIQRDSKGDEGIGMVQFEMSDLEDSGLLKLDFLGLRNLNVIDNALRKIKKNKGIDLDLGKIDEEDQDVYADIREGHTVGVFQLESEGMKKTVKQIKPETPEDICYLLAAYRPGPMEFIPEYVSVKSGEKEAHYILPELKPILSVTNGVITYQEQVMQIAQLLANYTLGDADILRRAMGKKKMEVMEAEKPKFVNGGVENGHPPEAMEEIWELLLKFANYGFNKSHAAAYAMVSYYTAYLKHHYPLEFMAALLEGDLDNFDRVVMDLVDCDRLGINVLPPSVNTGGVFFNTTEGNEDVILFGMGGIKNVGEDIVKVIIKERETNGRFLNFDDFLYRNIKHGLQKRATEYLIQAGALDEFGDRGHMIEALPNTFDMYKKSIKDEVKGQFDLFGGTEEKIHIDEQRPLPDGEPTPMHQILQWEKDLLGIYLSSHPLDDLQEFFQSKKAIPISAVNETKPSRKVIVIGGIVSEIKRITTKKGDPMAFITVEDKTGSIEMVVFPSAYEELMEELEPNKPTLFAGKLNQRDERRSFILEKAKTIDASVHGTNFQGITFKVSVDRTIEDINRLKSFIKDNPGDTTVKIMIEDGSGGEKTIYPNHRVEMNEQTEEFLKDFS